MPSHAVAYACARHYQGCAAMVLCPVHYKGVTGTLGTGITCTTCGSLLAFITRNLATGVEREYFPPECA